MPGYRTRGPFQTHTLRPQGERQVVSRATAGGIVLTLAQGIITALAGDDEPAGDFRPALELGCSGGLTLALPHEGCVEMRKFQTHRARQHMEAPGFCLAMVGDPARKLQRRGKHAVRHRSRQKIVHRASRPQQGRQTLEFERRDLRRSGWRMRIAGVLHMPSLRIWFFALCCGVIPAAMAETDAAQRTLFEAKYREVLRGATPKPETLARLSGYPLTVWLEYHPLVRRLRSLPVNDVRGFLARHDGSLPAALLRTAWLRETGRRGRFDLFFEDYTPQPDPELRCHDMRRQLDESAVPPRVVRDALNLWLSGRSQPPGCDEVFKRLRTRGALTDALVWERIMLAAKLGNTSLGVHVAKRYGTAQQRAHAELLHRVHGTPSTTLKLTAGRADSDILRDVIAHGLGRLAGQRLASADAAWRSERQRRAFTPVQAGVVQRGLALAAVAATHPERLAYLRAVDASAVDDAVERFRLREGLRARAWKDVLAWTHGEPRGATTPPLRWRYWQARALAETGQVEAAQIAFKALAAERDYYGFLAADRAGVPYAMINRPIRPTLEERSRIEALGGMQRAQEFYRLGRLGEARKEIAFEMDGRDLRGREFIAAQVNRWGWQTEAILMLGQMQSYDDLEMRFPLLHRPLVEKFARARGLSPALVYAIIRGESAFVTEARSPVGALGLMQVMPTTARATARQIGLRLRSPREITQVDKNIAIGSEYLRQTLRQFGGYFPLAAAAYNAGPSRVRTWLRGAACTPPDLWVDTLPFPETEGYVRRALFYAAVYEFRLGLKVSPFETRMADMTRQGTRTESTC